MAFTPSRVRIVPQRPRPSGINAVHLVHQNSTGQPWVKPGDDERGNLASPLPYAVPAELLRLPGRALAELDVYQPRAGEVHQLVERAANVLGVLDIGAVAAERLHHLVVAGAVDQRVRA